MLEEDNSSLETMVCSSEDGQINNYYFNKDPAVTKIVVRHWGPISNCDNMSGIDSCVEDVISFNYAEAIIFSKFGYSVKRIGISSSGTSATSSEIGSPSPGKCEIKHW